MALRYSGLSVNFVVKLKGDLIVEEVHESNDLISVSTPLTRAETNRGLRTFEKRDLELV